MHVVKVVVMVVAGAGAAAFLLLGFLQIQGAFDDVRDNTVRFYVIWSLILWAIAVLCAALAFSMWRSMGSRKR